MNVASTNRSPTVSTIPGANVNIFCPVVVVVVAPNVNFSFSEKEDIRSGIT